MPPREAGRTGLDSWGGLYEEEELSLFFRFGSTFYNFVVHSLFISAFICRDGVERSAACSLPHNLRRRRGTRPGWGTRLMSAGHEHRACGGGVYYISRDACRMRNP